jgi:hypothetical protein
MMVSSMDATAIVAIYGAILSTGIAGAQIAKWALARRTKLRIEVDRGCSWPTGAPTTPDNESIVLWIEVINDGEQTEQIAWVYVDRLRADTGRWEPNGGTGNQDRLEPRSRKTYIAAEEAVAQKENADIDIAPIAEPYRVRVVCGSGREFISSTSPAVER